MFIGINSILFYVINKGILHFTVKRNHAYFFIFSIAHYEREVRKFISFTSSDFLYFSFHFNTLICKKKKDRWKNDEMTFSFFKCNKRMLKENPIIINDISIGVHEEWKGVHD